jgi:CRP-like cAMP-binding protein
MTKHLKSPLHDPAQNRILGALPKSDYERLLPDLELIPLPLGWIMSDGGDHVNYLYFPATGIVTLMYDLEDGATSEVALVGNEGMVGISIFMGGESMPGSVHVQSEGYAYRLGRKLMKREFEMNGKLQHLALLYTQALICQTSQTAMCNKHHTVEQQFCRWLLMSIDRLHENRMEITQLLISTLLGVSRESVVRVAQKLEADGLIAGGRGSIKVLDRHKLETQACECYETVKKEYDRLLPHPRHAL